MSTNIQLVKKSSNAKTGPIPTTTSPRSTCPTACPLSGPGGCYAEAGYYTRMNWDKVDTGERGALWSDTMAAIGKLPAGQLWRHNVAGDLQGAADNVIDGRALRQLVEANGDSRGFTYTHYPMDRAENVAAVSNANAMGFTINVSHNSPREAIEAQHGQPRVTLVPGEEFWGDKIRKGNILRCPAETSDTITCATCKLCSVASRKDIIGFTAHGTRAKAVEVIASDC